MAIDADHVAVLESAIAQLAARYEAEQTAWDEALAQARAREQQRLARRRAR